MSKSTHHTSGAADLPEGYTERVIQALYENGDPVSIDAAIAAKGGSDGVA